MMNIEERKQIISTTHNIAYTLKVMKFDLDIMAEKAKNISGLHNDFSVLVDLLEVISDDVNDTVYMANKLYHFGMDAMNGGTGND